MSMRWVVALGSCALLIAGCTAEEHDSPASRDDLLPSIEDLPTGSEVDVLEGEEQLVLSVALDAINSGESRSDSETYTPTECAEHSRYADEARISLIEDASAVGVVIDRERTYIVLVSETAGDPTRVAEAHTGTCSTYVRQSSSSTHSYEATVRTERMDLPLKVVDEDAAIVSEVTDPVNPNWSNTEVTLGFASVSGYSVLVVAHQGKDSQPEFDDIFTRSIEKVRSKT
jgi:hypothetical protein